jgi:hypothetical protein
MHRRPLLLLVLAGCAGAAEGGAARPGADSVATPGNAAVVADSVVASGGDTSRAASAVTAVPAPAAAPGTPPRAPGTLPAVRGLYVNRFAAQTSSRMKRMLAIADSTEINALVIDAKDELGLNYKSANADFARNAGSGSGTVRDMKALVDTLHAHGILAIARIVVFKDPVAAGVNPDWTIKRPDGTVWRDEKGNAWVNPYNREVWSYNLGVAEELVRLGFDEIQWDYIRFPEPYKRLPQQVFAGQNGVSKPDLLAEYLKEARRRLNALGVRSTADVFGLVTTVKGPLEVGQEWEKVAPVTDVLLPMTYPSHYPRGAFGVARPNAEPFKIQQIAIARAKARDAKLGLTGERVRPWIQAFSLGQPKYDASHVKEQMRGIYAAGYNGWIWWHPGSLYEPFLPALEKELKSQTKE